MEIIETIERRRQEQKITDKDEAETKKYEDRRRERRQQLEPQREKNLASFQAFLERTGLKEGLEELRRVKKPDGEVLTDILANDASRMRIRFRWPVIKIPPMEFYCVSILWDSSESRWGGPDLITVYGGGKEVTLQAPKTEAEEPNRQFQERLTEAIVDTFLDPGWETDYSF